MHRAYAQATDRQTGLTDVEYEALVDIALGLTDQAIAHRRFLSRRGVTSRLHALYSKLGVEQHQLETATWGQTFSLRHARGPRGLAARSPEPGHSGG